MWRSARSSNRHRALFVCIGILCIQAAEGHDGRGADEEHSVQEQAIGLFEPPKVISRLGAGNEPGSLRSRVAEIDMQQIASARRGKRPLHLNLFEDISYEARIEKVIPTRRGYYLTGSLKGTEMGEFGLLVTGSIVTGTVNAIHEQFIIEPSLFGSHVVRQIDPNAIQDHHRHAPYEISYLQDQGQASAPTAQTPAPTNILVTDVLVVYSSTARIRAGGTRNIEAKIEEIVAYATTALNNSFLTFRFNLVHTAEMSYSDSGQTATNVARHLADPDDGHMDEIHALRNQYAADLVVAITVVPAGTVGGYARCPFVSIAQTRV